MLDVAPRGNGAVTPFVVQPEVLPGNGLLSTLANAITAVATTLNIQAGDAVNWPSSGVYRAVICQDPINGPWELVMVTGGQGSSTLQVTRAAESYNGNTTAYAWPVGTSISAVLTQAGLTAWRGAGGGGGTDVSSYFRSTGPGTLPTTGVGTEMFYQGTVQPTSAYTGSFYPHDYDPAGKAVMSSSEMNIGLSFTVDVACTLQAITFFPADPGHRPDLAQLRPVQRRHPGASVVGLDQRRGRLLESDLGRLRVAARCHLHGRGAHQRGQRGLPARRELPGHRWQHLARPGADALREFEHGQLRHAGLPGHHARHARWHGPGRGHQRAARQ